MPALKSPQQELFAQLVAKGNNPSDAYREAYPKSQSWKNEAVWSQASRLTNNSKVSARLDDLKQAASTRAEIDASYVLKRLAEIDQMDVIDILEDDGRIKPIRQWPKVWRQYLSGMDVSEIMQNNGDDNAVATVLKKIKWPDKLRNLELLGKHLNVGAFVERIDHSSKDGSMTPTAIVIEHVRPSHDGSKG
jgi:phage terminase small subunit